MDGSSASLIVIPIVVIASLAAWLILVAYAASHRPPSVGVACLRGYKADLYLAMLAGWGSVPTFPTWPR